MTLIEMCAGENIDRYAPTGQQPCSRLLDGVGGMDLTGFGECQAV